MIITMMPFCPCDEGAVPAPGKDYGYAINQAFDRLQDDDWGFVMDHDLVILTRTWFRSLEAAVERYPDAGFFTTMHAPSPSAWSVPAELSQEKRNFDPAHWLVRKIRMDKRNFTSDARFYRHVGEVVARDNLGVITDITHYEKLASGLPNSGTFLMSKRVWARVGGFNPGSKDDRIDSDMHNKIRDAGLKAYLLRDVLFLHGKGIS